MNGGEICIFFLTLIINFLWSGSGEYGAVLVDVIVPILAKFTALSIGGNAAYSYVSKQFSSDIWLLILTVIFSLFFPYLILRVKPEWLINIDE